MAGKGGAAGRALRPLVSAELARGVCALIQFFLRSRDLGREDAVVFLEISDDGYFYPTG